MFQILTTAAMQGLMKRFRSVCRHVSSCSDSAKRKMEIDK
jgi:hypothetical protein